jgi:hypothetical protein
LCIRGGLKGLIEVVCDLEQFEVVKGAFRSFETSSHGFHLSPHIDESFRLSRSGDPRIFEVGHREIEFWAHKEFDALLEVPGISPPILSSQGIPFGHGLGFSFREVKDIPEFFSYAFNTRSLVQSSTGVN